MPSPKMSACGTWLITAAVATAGAGLVVMNLTTAGPVPTVEQDVQLVNNAEADWSLVLSDTTANLSALQDSATEAGTKLSDAFTLLTNEFGGQLGNAVTGFGQGIENALGNGWWAPDDGYVFGVFGGTLTSNTGVQMSGSLLETLTTDLQGGQTLQAFTALDTWSLELLDHTLKPLLSPILDETSHGVTTYSIPVELSQIQTSLLETFTNYNTELKPLADALLAPFLGVGFGLSSDIQNVATDFAGADYSQALTDLDNLPSDLVQDFLNGYPAGSEAFPALLAEGGLLQELLVTLPTQLASALTEPFTAGSAEAMTATLPDLLVGLF